MALYRLGITLLPEPSNPKWTALSTGVTSQTSFKGAYDQQQILNPRFPRINSALKHEVVCFVVKNCQFVAAWLYQPANI